MKPLPSYFFDLAPFAHAALFDPELPVWSALERLPSYLKDLPYLLSPEAVISPRAFLINPEQIAIGAGSVVEPGAYIKGPCVIGKQCVVRQGAYIRGELVTGDHCVIGHDTEVKRAIFLNHTQAAHFAYVGDSILGSRVVLGAGFKCANLRLDNAPIRLEYMGETFETGMRKLGAIIGDGSKLGCNGVANPGTLMGKEGMAHPSLTLEGFIPSRSIVKWAQKPLTLSY